MNVIKLIDLVDASITADSIEVTVDSTSVTVDNTSSQIVATYYLDIIPRFYTTEVVATFTNELTQAVHTLNCSAVKMGNYLRVAFMMDANNNDSFSVTVKDLTGKLMWRGKVFATTQEDIQQYKVNVPNTNNVLIV
jgi:hypothetical protein